MTFRERFYKDYPEEAADPADFRCPSVCGYEEGWNCESPKNAEVTSCDECWDREMPDQKQNPHCIIEEDKAECAIGFTSKGLSSEERIILFDAIERALRRIRHRRRRDGRPDVQCQAVLK